MEITSKALSCHVVSWKWWNLLIYMVHFPLQIFRLSLSLFVVMSGGSDFGIRFCAVYLTGQDEGRMYCRSVPKQHVPCHSVLRNLQRSPMWLMLASSNHRLRLLVQPLKTSQRQKNRTKIPPKSTQYGYRML